MSIICDDPNPVVEAVMKKLTGCLKEAIKPLAQMALQKIKTYFTKEGGSQKNGKETEANT